MRSKPEASLKLSSGRGAGDCEDNGRSSDADHVSRNWNCFYKDGRGYMASGQILSYRLVIKMANLAVVTRCPAVGVPNAAQHNCNQKQQRGQKGRCSHQTRFVALVHFPYLSSNSAQPEPTLVYSRRARSQKRCIPISYAPGIRRFASGRARPGQGSAGRGRARRREDPSDSAE